MPYKDSDKQREAVRIAVKKHRSKVKQLIEDMKARIKELEDKLQRAEDQHAR